MIPVLLTKIGLPILTSIVAEGLGAIDSPVAKAASKALGKVDKAIVAGKITDEDVSLAQRHAERMVELELKAHEINLADVNESLRAEVLSSDLYVRRMRPTFGYLMAVTWTAQMLGLAYIIVFDTARAGEVMSAVSSLSAIWAVGLSVLGIYVYKRSEDKKINR